MVDLCSLGERVSPETRPQLNLVVLPPSDMKLQLALGSRRLNRSDLIARIQRLRGRVYLQDGAIEEEAVLDGRHRTPQDARSWHLLVEDAVGEIRGCVRAQVHHPATRLSRLAAYYATRTMDLDWGSKCKSALQAEMKLAHRLQIPVLEFGGLALDERIRGSSALVKMAAAIQNLADHLGGAIGIGTVTRRHNTTAILRRLGGQPLEVRGDSLPCYYDPRYRCEMEILKFYSWMPSHHHHKYIRFSEPIVSSFMHHHIAPRIESGLRRYAAAACG